jgi:hypothetical protein
MKWKKGNQSPLYSVEEDDDGSDVVSSGVFALPAPLGLGHERRARGLWCARAPRVSVTRVDI